MIELKPGQARAFESSIMPPITKYPPMPADVAVPARSSQAPQATFPSQEPAQTAVARQNRKFNWRVLFRLFPFSPGSLPSRFLRRGIPKALPVLVTDNR